MSDRPLRSPDDLDRTMAVKLLRSLAPTLADAVLAGSQTPRAVEVRRLWWRRLYARGWSVQRIAAVSGRDRTTVQRALGGET
jgi:hypothetical protein